MLAEYYRFVDIYKGYNTLKSQLDDGILVEGEKTFYIVQCEYSSYVDFAVQK